MVSSKIIYLIETDGERDSGVWSFRRHFDESVIIHADMTKACRGKKVVQSAKNAFKWIFENTNFKTIHAQISTLTKEKKAACFVAKWSGMEYTHFENNERYYQVNKNGLFIWG